MNNNVDIILVVIQTIIIIEGVILMELTLYY